MFSLALMDAAVLRSVAGDLAGAAHAARRAVDQAAHKGGRPSAADAVAAAALVLAGRSDSGVAAATVDGARHGAVLGHLPPTNIGNLALPT